jgi:hypothetical protein
LPELVEVSATGGTESTPKRDKSGENMRPDVWQKVVVKDLPRAYNEIDMSPSGAIIVQLSLRCSEKDEKCCVPGQSQ